VKVAGQEARAVLRDRHHLRPEEEDDFNIRNPEDIIQAQLDASRTLTILLIAIASISLIVGGIGIMNVMLVSVTERTREIGVRVAVGATEEATNCNSSENRSCSVWLEEQRACSSACSDLTL